MLSHACSGQHPVWTVHVPVVSVLNHLPDNKPGKSVAQVLGTLPATHVGDLEEAVGPWLWPCTALTTAVSWSDPEGQRLVSLCFSNN